MSSLLSAVYKGVLLSIVLLGVQHFTGHWCIALAVVAGLKYNKE